jgi:H+/Cl- antiporter ClcA
MDIITNAVNGSAKPEAFLLKIVFTAITIGAGYKGGEIVPTFFIGATLGCIVGSILGIGPGFGAAIGLIALFCSVVNCPVTSIILSIEIFGAKGFMLFVIACAVS